MSQRDCKRARCVPQHASDDVLFHRLLQQAMDTPPVYVWRVADIAQRFSQLKTPIPMVIDYLSGRPELLQHMALIGNTSIGALLRTSDDDPQFAFAQPLKALARMYLCMLHDTNWERGQEEEKADDETIERFSTPDVRFLVPGHICHRQQSDRLTWLLLDMCPHVPDVVIRGIIVPYLVH